jgi:inositol 1,4,5-triphosphate receptor type 1/inositol 1,4,5-triphosphate receptor type 3
MSADPDIDPTLLTFGCILAIADFKNQNGFIFSDGFLKTSVYLQSFPTSSLE